MRVPLSRVAKAAAALRINWKPNEGLASQNSNNALPSKTSALTGVSVTAVSNRRVRPSNGDQPRMSSWPITAILTTGVVLFADNKRYFAADDDVDVFGSVVLFKDRCAGGDINLFANRLEAGIEIRRKIFEKATACHSFNCA